MNKRLKNLLVFASLLLSIPMIAMQFTDEVNWSLRDFIVMGVILFGTAISIELVMRKAKGLKFKLIFVGAVLLIAIILWAELAVGIFGTPFAGS